MSPRSAAGALLFVLSACDEGAALPIDGEATPAAPTTPEDVSVPTLDGFELSATWQAAPRANRGPGLLLLHQFGPGEHDRHDWDPVFERLVSAGVSVLALDFRSHGSSPAAAVPDLDLLSNREQLPFDVRAGLDFLRDLELLVGPERIGVAGLSVGGNLAVVASNWSDGSPSDWGARRLLTVSALEDRARDLAGDDSLQLRDGCYAAAAFETDQADDTQVFFDQTAGDRERLLIEGTDLHGADLLSDSEPLRAAIVRWFEPAAW